MGGVARASVSTQRLLLLQRREPQTTGILAITGDRGLAGGFNAQIVRRAVALSRELEAEGQTVSWLASGRKGRSTLRFRGFEPAADWTGFSDRPDYSDAQAIAHKLAELFVAGEVDRVVVIYNHFESPLVQRVTEQEVLPIPEHLLETDDEERRQDAERGDFIYEPEPEEILARLLPVYLETEIYRALLESAASEQGADDRDAERLEERGRADRHAHAADEPCPPGRDHAGDPRGGGRGRRLDRVDGYPAAAADLVAATSNREGNESNAMVCPSSGVCDGLGDARAHGRRVRRLGRRSRDDHRSRDRAAGADTGRVDRPAGQPLPARYAGEPQRRQRPAVPQVQIYLRTGNKTTIRTLNERMRDLEQCSQKLDRVGPPPASEAPLDRIYGHFRKSCRPYEKIARATLAAVPLLSSGDPEKTLEGEKEFAKIADPSFVAAKEFAAALELLETNNLLQGYQG